jgi:hypothetical protein
MAAMRPYVVRPGDYLRRIAYCQGFDADDVWGRPENAALRGMRRPDMLNPGDVLHVPVSEPDPLSIEAGGDNRYVCDVPTVDVRLLFHERDEPIRREECVVKGLGEPLPKHTGDSGELDLEVPVDVHELTVYFPELGLLCPVAVGYLDPVETASGFDGRLSNLGYASSPHEGSALGAGAPEAMRQRARAAFEADVSADSITEHELRHKLAEKHGC